MEMYGNIRCVTYDELVGGGILTKHTYDWYVKENRLHVLRKGGGKGRPALLEYNSLPSKVRTEYDARNPEAKNELKQEIMSNILIRDDKAIVFFRDKYNLPDGSGLSDKKQEEYVLNAEVLNAMIRTESLVTAEHRKCGYNRRSEVWLKCVECCEDLREIHGHTLPKNTARLREKFNAYKRDGYPVLVSLKHGNQNTRKLTAVEKRLLLALRRSKVPVYTDRQIFEEYNRKAAMDGLPEIKSMSTIVNYLNAPEVMPLWYGAVYGMQKWKAKFSSLMKTEMPQMRDSLWYSDGTKLNLYYRDDKGKMRTTSVYEVMDTYTEVLLGYDIAPGETFDSQYRAFRMAVEFARHRPYEIVNDNQGGHSKLAAQGFFKRICTQHKPTMPYNGPSKTIESAFGRFQQQVLHKLWFFTGQNVTAKKLNSKPDMEFISHNAYALPTLEEVKEIYRQCREEWNNMPHHATGISRMEMYLMSDNPGTKVVEEADMRTMFWLKSRNAIAYTNKGLMITINKQEYEYEVYGDDGLRDEEWALRNTGRKFHVMYDPMDMTRVELWEETPTGLRYSTDATPRVTIKRATQERTAEETSFMRRTIELNKATMGLVQLTMEDFDLEEKIAVELFGLSTPKPKNLKQDEMDRLAEEMESGMRKAPVSLPELAKQKEEEEDLSMAYSSYGSYTKAISNMDYADDDDERYDRI